MANLKECEVITSKEWLLRMATTTEPTKISQVKISRRRATLQKHLGLVIIIIIVSAFFSVFTFGSIFYINGRKATISRYEAAPGV